MLRFTGSQRPSCMFLAVQLCGPGSVGHCGLTWGDLCPAHAMQSMRMGGGWGRAHVGW